MTNPCTVLIVDDDADVRDALCALLALDGYRPRAAASAEEALRHADGMRFDAICCDLHLAAGDDGLALAARLKARLPAARLLALTGDASATAAERAAAAGFAALLVKPVDYAALLAALAGR